MAVAGMTSGNYHPVGPLCESFKKQHEVYTTGTRETHNAHVRCVLHAARSGQVGPGIRTPIAYESYYFRLESVFVFILFHFSFFAS